MGNRLAVGLRLYRNLSESQDFGRRTKFQGLLSDFVKTLLQVRAWCYQERRDGHAGTSGRCGVSPTRTNGRMRNTETARGDSARLLTASSDDELLAYHAIGVFAGLRMPEIVKLDWHDVNFEKGFIDVGILKAKTRIRRHAPLTDNLRAWLQPIAKPIGKIISG